MQGVDRNAGDEELRRHLSEVVKSTQDAVLSKDLDGFVTSWNPAAERLYGYRREDVIGRHISFLIPGDRKNEEERILDHVRRRERVDTYETERVRSDGTRVDVSLTVSPIISGTDQLLGASVIARDITAERRRRRARDFLLAASRQIGTSLDRQETARQIVEAAIPEFAELCVIDFLREDGMIGSTVAAGVDPAEAAQLERVRRENPISASSEHPVAEVLRNGRPLLWHAPAGDLEIAEIAQGESHREFVERAEYGGAAIAPLRVRGRLLGTFSFVHMKTDAAYDDADLELVTDLAERAALALDNARLYEERAELAAALQRFLRPPEPPRIPGLDVSVVSEPAGEGIEIGGDAFDVISVGEDHWFLIADVVGKGSAAAAVSVAIRQWVRSLVHELVDPAAILGRVNALLRDGGTLHDFATAILVRARPLGTGAWAAELACAGHPAAVVFDRGGATEMGGGSLLGAFGVPSIARHRFELQRGQSLLLATDGWFECGPVAGHLDSRDITRLSMQLADRRLDEVTAALRDDAIDRAGGKLRDDLVVLAVRPVA
jgi:PAS domain S-box-containing protein